MAFHTVIVHFGHMAVVSKKHNQISKRTNPRQMFPKSVAKGFLFDPWRCIFNFLIKCIGCRSLNFSFPCRIPSIQHLLKQSVFPNHTSRFLLTHAVVMIRGEGQGAPCPAESASFGVVNWESKLVTTCQHPLLDISGADLHSSNDPFPFA